MNAPLSKKEAAAFPALLMGESELLDVLRNSLYPGASDGSIKMVIGYCKATNLDPMQKPVHIVPMNVKKPGTRDQYEWRDVIMPGIGLYRIQAARTGEHVGTSEPEFGPMITVSLAGKDYTFPEWCKVTVFRWKHGAARAYEAKEYWLENYATAGRNTDDPNAMWKKRSRGQIAKCAEAQALRKAFPEVGEQPTAEEMEGKTHFDFDMPADSAATAASDIKMPSARPALTNQPTGEVIEMPLAGAKREEAPVEQARESAPAQTAAANTSSRASAAARPQAEPKPVSESVMRILKTKLEVHGRNELDMKAKFGFGFEGVNTANYNELAAWATGA